METGPLPNQDQSDVNDMIARRIRLIYKEMSGGLGEFFERLKQDRQEESPAQHRREKILETRLKEVAMHAEESERGNN